MNIELDDQLMADQLRAGFDGASYGRTASDMRGRPRLPVAAAAVVAAAIVATAVVVGSNGGGSPALAWSPVPAIASPQDDAAARAACTKGGASDLNATVVAAPGGSTAQPSLPARPPTVLPPLVSFDLRGNGGLAVFADDTWTVSCMLLRKGSGFETGPIITGPSTDLPVADGSLAVLSALETLWGHDQSLSLVWGLAPVDAATVELTIPGQLPATADVKDGRFSIWWLGHFDPAVGSLRALAGDGHVLASIDSLVGLKG